MLGPTIKKTGIMLTTWAIAIFIKNTDFLSVSHVWIKAQNYQNIFSVSFSKSN
jgi:hypothetical protein